MSKHDGHSRETVSVTELLEREAAIGTPLRLNWPARCVDPHGGVRDWDDDEWPTGELPVLTAELLAELDTRAGEDVPNSGGESQVTEDTRCSECDELAEDEPAQLPKRASPPAPHQLWEPDEGLLERILGGLRQLS